MTTLSHVLLSDMITKKDVVVDATMGNGQDTLFLARIASYVYAFDIQNEALQKTRALLEKHDIENVELIQDSHVRIPDYVKTFTGVVFNLGYLPGGNKSVTTQTDTTLRAIDRLLPIIETGFLLIVCYPGHAEGKQESEAISNRLSTLDPKIYQVTTIHHPYQPHDPPLIHLIIGQKKDGT
jgi:SAM-dependent methyltransferase